jgi:hypothetical protein
MSFQNFVLDSVVHKQVAKHNYKTLKRKNSSAYDGVSSKAELRCCCFVV